MVIAQLLASPFLGGPEKQVLGLAAHLPADCRTVMLSFSERGGAGAFLAAARAQGCEAIELRSNWPRVRRVAAEIVDLLAERRVDLLVANGYKPDVLGWSAARRAGIPIVAIAHGWTGATWKVRLNERLDRAVMRRCDAVVGVSQAQSRLLAQARVRPDRITTIPNAVPIGGNASCSDQQRAALAALFPSAPLRIVGAAGRLSPEKGFERLVEAAALVTQRRPDVGFVVFGEGQLRSQLEAHIAARRLQDRFVLPGFHSDLAPLLAELDVVALPSLAEGLPVILLEAMAAGLPIVATRVGGIPEAVLADETGLLVPPNDAEALAAGLERLLDDEELRDRLGAAARARVAAEYSCERQAARYYDLFQRVLGNQRKTGTGALAG
ncbi:MAG: glycosyltransferase family 4 protein [Pirellulales bacterium]|nr:glycosyltransferase family 4 protein [Pirellulales bacterium]